MLFRPLCRYVSLFQSSKNYYQTLKVSASSSQAEIKKSYHDLARVYHPDSKTGNENKFKEIAEAFEVLGDDKIRSEYDAARRKVTGTEQVFRGNPSASQSFKEANFSKMSDEEKIKRARERHEKWQRAANAYYRQPNPDSKAWSGGRHTFTGTSHYYSNKEDKPSDALSVMFTSIAIGILVCLSYWSMKTVYAIMSMPSASMQIYEKREDEARAVFAQTRGSQRVEKPQTMETVTPARVTRNKFVEKN